MKNSIAILTFFCFMTISAQKAAVQKTVEDFFVAFHAKDTTALRQFCSDKMILRSIAETKNGNQLTESKLKDFLKNIASIPTKMQFEERILGFEIQITNSLANVWTPYAFYINQKLSHSGVNSFQMFLDNGFWKIINLIDTRAVQ